MNNQLAPIIGLVTPYTGRNLGDGAIQESVIANIRARYPNASLHGFTISPVATQALHKIPCSSLTALSICNYSHSTPSKSVGMLSHSRTGVESLQYFKILIKKIPPVYRAMRLVKRKFDNLSDNVSFLLAEFRLIGRGVVMLKHFDLLIVSGGGQLDDYWGGAWGHPFNLLKWGLLARVTGTRYIFLSIGTCTLDSSLSKSFIKWALKLASYRSYRDQKSKELLHHLSFTRNDAVYPDLAFSHPIPVDKEISSRANIGTVVGISPIAYLSSYYWPQEDLTTYNSYMQTLTDFVSYLLKHDFSVIFFHTSGTDKFVVNELMDTLCSHRPPPDDANIKVVNTETVGELLSLLTNLDCVVASRLHGVILSHLMNKPVLAISYDRKVTTYMEEVQQSDYCVDIMGFQLESLISKFIALNSNRDAIKLILAKRTAEFKRQLDIQYDEVLGMLR